ncbi:CDP-glycerol glycerophosphotransferase family protein [Bacillus sp. PS06]|nr:CDP-glycerol glycerophosphotransferase family protein [Bacillus sp. PS06]
MSLLSKGKSFLKQIVVSVYQLTFRLAGLLPVKRNMIIFESFLGKQYSDNPRAIYEYLKQNHPEYELCWSVDKRNKQRFDDHQINYVERFTIKWLFKLARAEFWVSNSRLPLWIPKPKHTTYIQTWHGTPLKKLALDMKDVHMHGTVTDQYKKEFVQEASKWDYLISPNAYSTEIFKRAFHFKGTIIESGYPRNDYLISHNNIETINTIKEGCSLPLDKKIILYAPTWRDDQFYGSGKYKFQLQLDLKKLKEEFGQDYVIILRMHYLVAENIDLDEYKGFALDYSHYEDIRDLYVISDLLVTDYSSVFFDYAILKRPIIFFTYDIESYRDKLRGFYFDFEKESPGPLVRTTKELIDQIHLAAQMNLYESKDLDSFYQTFTSLEDGQATKRVVEQVFVERITS